ncbi:MAG TPA: hypothetical protein VFK05_14800 [Polyangiaceae bacterium]|nr:hypothetical protein [Polyangiaceae bacterium]
MSEGGSAVSTTRLVSPLLCLALLASACSSEPLTAPAPSPKAAAVAGCESFDATPCNTMEHDCQVSRFELAACLRQVAPGTLPKVTYMTEQQYIDYIDASWEGWKPPETNHFEIAMTWLGLAEHGSFDYVSPDPAEVAGWFGTYRWRNKDLLIIDHGRPADDAASNVELVAAWIRALRDRDINIGIWTTAVAVFDVDSNWGADAMYFGEARFFSNRYRAAVDGVAPNVVDEAALINRGIVEDVAWIRSQPSTYVATNNRFAYNFGARAAYLAWRRNGVDAVNALYQDKMLTHQLMASETEEGPRPTAKYHTLPRASEEWEYSPVTTAIGAWGLFLSLSRHLDQDAAWALSLSWRGEQLFVHKGLEPNEHETALIWQLEMADEASAAALEDVLESYPKQPQVRRGGTFVTLAISSNETPLDWAFVDETSGG